MDHCERFYIRTSNCASRKTEFMEHAGWTEVDTRNSRGKGVGGNTHCGVASSTWDPFLADKGLRLVVQRTEIGEEIEGEDSNGIFSTEYVYRCLLTL